MFKGTKNAFTLAEVLITLGIIGVVAAMTMPTLLNSTQGAQYRTAYKKALSVLSQAVVLNIALDDYDLSQTAVNTETSVYNLFNNRMNVAKVCGGGGAENTGGVNCPAADQWSVTLRAAGADGTGGANIDFGANGNYTFFFNDGITLTFPTGTAGCTEGNASGGAANLCLGAVDVNGKKNPNKLITCDAGTSGDNCKVTNPTDVYPIVMYDQTVAPNTKAAKAVLFGGK